MTFAAIVIFAVALCVAFVVYVGVKRGKKEACHMVRSLLLRVCAFCGVVCLITLSLVLCYDCVSSALKEVISHNCIEEIKSIFSSLFGTISIFTAIKTLLFSCVMISIFSCFAFVFSGMVAYFVRVVTRAVCTCRKQHGANRCLGFFGFKAFITYGKFIS